MNNKEFKEFKKRCFINGLKKDWKIFKNPTRDDLIGIIIVENILLIIYIIAKI